MGGGRERWGPDKWTHKDCDTLLLSNVISHPLDYFLSTRCRLYSELPASFIYQFEWVASRYCKNIITVLEVSKRASSSLIEIVYPVVSLSFSLACWEDLKLSFIWLKMKSILTWNIPSAKLAWIYTSLMASFFALIAGVDRLVWG